MSQVWEDFFGLGVELCVIPATNGNNATLHLNEAQQFEFDQVFDSKKEEWLASRQALCTLFSTETPPYYKDSLGKPMYLPSPGHPYHFLSMSHTAGFGAAIKGYTPVGVDLQVLTPKLRNIDRRFCSFEELRMIEESQYPLETLHVYWGAKESIYKAYGLRGLDALENNFVDAFTYHPNGGITFGRAIKDGITHEYKVAYTPFEGCILCAVVLVSS